WPATTALQPSIVPGELVEGEWIAPRAALARWEAGTALVAPPVHFFLQVLAEVGIEGGLARLRTAQGTFLRGIRKIEFRRGVLTFPVRALTSPPALTTNCMLLGFGDGGVLVDPGCADGGEQRRLIAALGAARERTGRRAIAIWLTHHHPDHVAGVETLRAALGGVPVLAHPATAERVANVGIRVDA